MTTTDAAHSEATHLLARDSIDYHIDAPEEGQVAECDSLVRVSGWVTCKDGPIARVEVFVNYVACGRARLGVARPDVATWLSNPEACVSGFEMLIDLGALDVSGEHVRVAIWVETLHGQRHLLNQVTLGLRDRPEQETEPDPVESIRLARRTVRRGEIRLLVFTHHLGLGGGQLYLFELLRVLSETRNFEATVVAPTDGVLRKATEALGIPVVINGPHPVGGIQEYESRQAVLGAWARAAGFNAVLANTFNCFPGVDLAGRLGLPAVWAIHESFTLSAFWHAAYGSIDAVHPRVRAHAEAALKSAAVVVFEAEATRDLFVRHGDSRRFVTIPYGIDLEGIDRYAAQVTKLEARRQLQLPEDATILLCLGTIEPRKAQGALAQAFATIASRNPEAVLAFVGAGRDASSEALRDFVRGTGLASQVRIAPVTPNIYPWYRAADALVCPSDVESLPRTALEAMAFSVPVIATRVFGLPELIDDGVTGYLCEPRDTRELIDVMSRFLSTTPDEREAVGAAAAALVRERHDSRGYSDAYYRLLQSLLEDPKRIPASVLATPRSR